MSETAHVATGISDDPWGERARDWAEVEDEGSRKLFESVLDEAAVGSGTRLLDVGCGSGLACALAAARGAQVSGVDSSPGLLELARERTAQGDFREGEMTSLPWHDDVFDVVTFVNSIFFADVEAALREAARVVRRGGHVVAVVWTSPERIEATAYLAALEPLLPPLPAEVDPFIRPEALEHLARRAGLAPQRAVELDWTWEYPDLDTLLRGWLSVGLTSLAIRNAGEEAVRAALVGAAEPFRLASGEYRLENTVLCLVATA